MKQTKIFHVELREPVIIDGEPQKDFYFGSKTAIYGTLSSEQRNNIQLSPVKCTP